LKNSLEKNSASTLPKTKLVSISFLGLICFGLLQVSCAPLMVQSPNSNLRPVNAVKSDGASRLIIQGYDVVSYFQKGQAEKGNPEIKFEHEDVTFFFSSEEHKASFQKDPSSYIPQFGGYCANGIVYGIPWGGDGDAYSIIDGKLYIFGGSSSKEAFELAQPENLKLAHEYWENEVSGTNALYQRVKRLVFKVPHYKTGGELAQAVEAKKAQSPPAN